MEEILASIRRIIADDDAARSREREQPEPGMDESSPRESDRLSAAFAAELHASVAPPLARAGADARRGDRFDARPASSDIAARAGPGGGAGVRCLDLTEQTAAWRSQRRALGRDMPTGRRARPRRRLRARSRSRSSAVEADEGGKGGLISAATTAAVDSAFNTLAQTVLVQNGRTLEDLVRRNAAAAAQDLARRQSSGHGRAAGARRDRAGLARQRLSSARCGKVGTGFPDRTCAEPIRRRRPANANIPRWFPSSR